MTVRMESSKRGADPRARIIKAGENGDDNDRND